MRSTKSQGLESEASKPPMVRLLAASKGVSERGMESGLEKGALSDGVVITATCSSESGKEEEIHV